MKKVVNLVYFKICSMYIASFKVEQFLKNIKVLERLYSLLSVLHYGNNIEYSSSLIPVYRLERMQHIEKCTIFSDTGSAPYWYTGPCALVSVTAKILLVVILNLNLVKILKYTKSHIQNHKTAF